MIGSTLLHYRIVEKLGAGGMGEVFLAYDPSLDRKVALKFLPDIFSSDPERLARFEREAKLLASLNHPNIAAIYGLEAAGGKRFLVLELVEGETLAKRLIRGPLSVDESLEICRQIAEGVEAAHEKGIIHRDLKPANVKITPEGKVKVLDFGLAKALSEEPAISDFSRSPTLTDQMTRPGVILGTAAYMSPEQAKGKAVDKRADIWALGCILFECLTGKRAFDGETATEILAAVIKGEPDWNMLPADTSYGVRSMLRRCLQKDLSLRLRDIADARTEILDAAPGASGIQEAVSRESTRWRVLPWIVAAAAITIAAVFGLQSVMIPEPPPAKTMRFRLSLPVPLHGVFTMSSSLAISFDGQQLAYVGGAPPNTRLYHLRLDDSNPEFKPIPGTDRVESPFFSPDGKWIAFFADGILKKMPLAGGPVKELTGLLGRYVGQGVYEDSDFILFIDLRKGIFRVSALGGTPEPLMAPDFQKDECSFNFPQRLPERDLILFTVASPQIESMNDAQIAVRSVGAKSVRMNLTSGTFGRYLPTGHLVWGYDGKLMAAPFDLATLKISESKQVLDGVFMTPGGAYALFAVSNQGHLVYVPGTMFKSADSFMVIDRKGNKQPIPIYRPENAHHGFAGLSLSWDGRRIAVSLAKANNDIHTCDIAGGPLARVTYEGGDEQCPLWHPDGRLAYTSEPGPKYQMLLKNLNSSEEAELLFRSENPRYPSSFSKKGDVLAFVEKNPKTGWDIWTGPIGNKGQPEPFRNTDYQELFPAISPDGHWIAYQSDKSAQPEVYVARYPGGRDDEQISLEGGTEPRWDPNGSGNELFYRSAKGVHVAEIAYSPKAHATNRILLVPED